MTAEQAGEKNCAYGKGKKVPNINNQSNQPIFQVDEENERIILLAKRKEENNVLNINCSFTECVYCPQYSFVVLRAPKCLEQFFDVLKR